MGRKIKTSLFLIFLFILGIIFFVILNNRAVAPHVIFMQNDPAVLPGEELDSDNSTVTETPAENIIPKDTTKEVSAQAKTVPENPEPATEKKETTLAITPKLVSWGYTPTTNRKIDTIIIHSSYNALGGDEYDFEKLIQEYKEYGVAPHYLIDRKGKIYQLVADKNIAYHAGESKTPDGRTQVNNFSLGIEMMNTEDNEYTSEQYQALKNFLSQIKANYSIKYVLGHSDIAPERKTDPWNFDWKKVK